MADGHALHHLPGDRRRPLGQPWDCSQVEDAEAAWRPNDFHFSFHGFGRQHSGHPRFHPRALRKPRRRIVGSFRRPRHPYHSHRARSGRFRHGHHRRDRARPLRPRRLPALRHEHPTVGHRRHRRGRRRSRAHEWSASSVATRQSRLRRRPSRAVPASGARCRSKAPSTTTHSPSVPSSPKDGSMPRKSTRSSISTVS